MHDSCGAVENEQLREHSAYPCARMAFIHTLPPTHRRWSHAQLNFVPSHLERRSVTIVADMISVHTVLLWSEPWGAFAAFIFQFT